MVRSPVAVQLHRPGSETTIDPACDLRSPGLGWSGGARIACIWKSRCHTFVSPGPLLRVPELVLGFRISRKSIDGGICRQGLVRSCDAAFPGFLTAPIDSKAGSVYRGDLHMHTGHSDAPASEPGVRSRVRCSDIAGGIGPPSRFHCRNRSQRYRPERVAAGVGSYFDNLLLIPGREVTNIQGPCECIRTHELPRLSARQ